MHARVKVTALRRRKLPSLNALRAFEAAARHLSFKEAAEELNVSQSAVSHQVKSLEETLGIALFTRGVRSVELTLRGRQYYPVVRDAFDALAEGMHRILEANAPEALTLQVYSTFTIRWLLPRLSGFHKLHQGIEVRLTTAQADANFERDGIDAAIMIAHADSPSLYYEYLFDAEMFPVCSPDYLQRVGAHVRPEDLQSRQLLQVYPSADDWCIWLERHGLVDLDPEQGLQLESYDVALGSAAQGMGVALGQQPYLERDLASGVLVEMFVGARVLNPRRWYLVARRERCGVHKLRVFSDWLLQEVRADPQLLRSGDSVPLDDGESPASG